MQKHVIDYCLKSVNYTQSKKWNSLLKWRRTWKLFSETFKKDNNSFKNGPIKIL